MKKESARKIRRAGVFLFILYLIALIYFLFFAEEYGRTITQREYSYNLEPLKEIKRFLQYRSILGPIAVATNLGGNVLGFIPFGAILPIINKNTRKFLIITLLSFEFSLMVEIAQLVFKVGSFDVDDLILNTIGGIIGYLLFYLCNKLRRKYYG